MHITLFITFYWLPAFYWLHFIGYLSGSRFMVLGWVLISIVLCACYFNHIQWNCHKGILFPTRIFSLSPNPPISGDEAEEWDGGKAWRRCVRLRFIPGGSSVGSGAYGHRRIAPQNPLWLAAHHLAEAWREQQVPAREYVRVPRVQNECEERHAVHHRTLHQLRPVHRAALKPAAETLDQPWGGCTLPAGRLNAHKIQNAVKLSLKKQ